MGRPTAPRGAMAVDDAFQAGTQVLLEWFDRADVYHAARTVLDEVDADGLVLQAPIERRRVIPLEPGTEVTVICRRQPHSVAGAVRVTGMQRADPPILRTTRPQSVEKTTHRRFYRVATDLPVTIDGAAGRLLDLSGSGCLLCWPDGRAPDAGERVRFEVRLPPATLAMTLQGRVVRRPPAGDRAALDFVGLTRRQQDGIIRYVFARQNELLRQGLLRTGEQPVPARWPRPGGAAPGWTGAGSGPGAGHERLGGAHPAR